MRTDVGPRITGPDSTPCYSGLPQLLDAHHSFPYRWLSSILIPPARLVPSSFKTKGLPDL